MVRTCSANGIKIYVDVIINHMSATLPVNTKGTGGSDAVTSKKNYPAVPYTSDNFHPTCSINNYQSTTQVRNCEIVGLHDLNQTIPYVRNKILQYMNHLIDLGVSGFRIDAAKHMWPSDLKAIYNSLKDLNQNFGHPQGSKPFIYQEVIDEGTGAVKYTDYKDLGLITEFKYSDELSKAFKGKNKLKWLRNFGEPWNFMNSKSAIVFVDNHDNQRGNAILNYKSPKLYKMAVGFMLSWPYGTKRVMSSFDFKQFNDGPPHDENFAIKNVTTNADLTCNNGWICEHRWRQIYSMVKFDKVTNGTPVTDFQDNGANQISFCRGNKGFVAFNGDNFNMNIRRKVCLPSGTYCDVISGLKGENKCTGKMVTVDKDGLADIQINSDEEDGLLAIHTEAKLSTQNVLVF
ncbi:alpha-amylase A isoform X2 [Cimex lectularius]|nr:alpha-amylase A isoform X2 [Cimex lectularius]